MLLDPLLTQTVTPSRVPTSLKRDVLYGRPLRPIYLVIVGLYFIGLN